MASCRDCPSDSASCRDSRQEAKSHGQSLQESIYQAQESQQEARDHESLGGSQISRTVSLGSINLRPRVYPVSMCIGCFGKFFFVMGQALPGYYGVC